MAIGIQRLQSAILTGKGCGLRSGAFPVWNDIVNGLTMLIDFGHGGDSLKGKEFVIAG
jgi:hypothetical protein